MSSLAKRVIRQILGDKRTVALILFAPMLILTLIYLLLGDTHYKPTIAVDSDNALLSGLIAELENHEVNVIHINIEEINIESFLKDEADIILSFSDDGLVMTMYESSSKTGKAMKMIQDSIASLNPLMRTQINYVIGHPEESLFDSMGYIFFGIISFFLIFIISGMALVRERSSGTLERMLMTPITRAEVIGGYTVGFGVFAVLQAIILVVFSVYVLNLPVAGHIIWVILIMFLLAVSAVAFGELISIFANTEFQVVQFIPIAIIPQVFFSGLIPLDTIPYHLGNLCYIMPVYYGCAAIKEVMVVGHGFNAVLPFIFALLVYIFVLSALNITALKKYRKL